jgi:hypothetical protein
MIESAGISRLLLISDSKPIYSRAAPKINHKSAFTSCLALIHTTQMPAKLNLRHLLSFCRRHISIIDQFLPQQHVHALAFDEALQVKFFVGRIFR